MYVPVYSIHRVLAHRQVNWTWSLYSLDPGLCPPGNCFLYKGIYIQNLVIPGLGWWCFYCGRSRNKSSGRVLTYFDRVGTVGMERDYSWSFVPFRAVCVHTVMSHQFSWLRPFHEQNHTASSTSYVRVPSRSTWHIFFDDAKINSKNHTENARGDVHASRNT